tara:strand:- start:264 stop:599 length:336 start_codon:yes stop_codon:yes gene_type:complete
MADPQLIYTTWPDSASAEGAARALLEARLIACANIMAAGVSLYRWEGRVQRDAETVMILKTTTERTAELRHQVETLHPYDTPCILALPIDAASSHAGFVDWIVVETGTGDA